jgi:hypothetical protein
MKEINIEHIKNNDQETDELFVATDKGDFVTSVQKGLSMMYMINIVTCMLEENGFNYHDAEVIFDGELIEALKTV